MSIRARLLVILLVGLALVLVAGGSAVQVTAESGLLRQFDARLQSDLDTLVSLVAYEGDLLKFDTADADALLAGRWYELRRESGQVLKRSRNLAEASLAMDGQETADPHDVDLPLGIDGRAASRIFVPAVDVDEDDDEYAAAAAAASPIDPEPLVAVVALDRDPIDRALAALVGALVAVGGVLAATVTCLVVLGVRWGLMPLDRLGRVLGTVDGASMDRRLDGAAAPVELRPIYDELNAMLDRVGSALERERAFARAAAHELRTPLAELRSTAEVALRWPDRTCAASTLRELLAVGSEMERLVEMLLALSRPEIWPAGDGAVHEPTALGPIVQRRLEQLQPFVERKQLRVETDLSDRVMTAPRTALEIITGNLIENAVHHTPNAGRLRIRTIVNGTTELLVENEPVQLAPSDLARLFEPFWQSDPSRSDRGHIGLGLSLVQRTAEAVGLEVRAALDGHCLTMRVVSPRPEPGAARRGPAQPVAGASRAVAPTSASTAPRTRS